MKKWAEKELSQFLWAKRAWEINETRRIDLFCSFKSARHWLLLILIWFHCVYVCGHVSVPGADRGGEGEGERLHVDPGGRAGELQRRPRAVEDAAGGHRTGAGQHQRRVSVFKSFHVFYCTIQKSNVSKNFLQIWHHFLHVFFYKKNLRYV